MRTLGLTGGVGMGKSTVADLLRRRGLDVVDTDLLARQVVEPGQPALEEIRSAFGDGMIAPDGTLRREELARCVFADTLARRKLEGIVHPRIHALWQQRVAELRAADRAAAVVVVIPLLFETNTQSFFDATICLACSGTTQRRRLLARGWTDDQIRQRNEAQLPIQKKMELADYVIWNDGPLEVLAAQVDPLLGRSGGLC